jgi:hypothetical protein
MPLENTEAESSNITATDSQLDTQYTADAPKEGDNTDGKDN